MNSPLPRLLILSFVSVFTSSAVEAGEIAIRGNSKDYSGETLTFYSYSNMVSFAEKEMGNCQVSDSGDFHCIIELEETRLVFTRLGVYNCFFFAEPGTDYELLLPARRDKTLAEEANPYFEDTSLHLSVKAKANPVRPAQNQPGEDLNFLIRAFDDYFYPYYYKFVVNAYGNNTDRDEVNKTILVLKETFDSVVHPYFNAYLKFRTGLLSHYGGQYSRKKIIGDYFLDSEVLYFNPAYMELFNEVFQDYFKQFAQEHPEKQIQVLLNRQKDFSGIQRLMKKESALQDDALREMVMVKGLYDGLFDEQNIRSSMLSLLDSVGNNASVIYTREMVSDIKTEFTRHLQGYKPEDFALYDSDSNLVRLSDFRGSYVYLNFCNSFSYYCIKEYEYLKILQQRMEGKNLKMVTILVDDSFSMMKDLAGENNYPWTFLHFSNQPGVLESYYIRSYPAYFLIGPEGEMILSPAPSPMENFQNTFMRIAEPRQ